MTVVAVLIGSATSAVVPATGSCQHDRVGEVRQPGVGRSDVVTISVQADPPVNQAFGRLIGQLSQQIPETSPGVLVVPHSRAMARGILTEAAETPTHIATATRDSRAPVAGLQRWIDTPQARTVEDLLNLPSDGLERWRDVNRMVETANRKKRR